MDMSQAADHLAAVFPGRKITLHQRIILRGALRAQQCLLDIDGETISGGDWDEAVDIAEFVHGPATSVPPFTAADLAAAQDARR